MFSYCVHYTASTGGRSVPQCCDSRWSSQVTERWGRFHKPATVSASSLSLHLGSPTGMCSGAALVWRSRQGSGPWCWESELSSLFALWTWTFPWSLVENVTPEWMNGWFLPWWQRTWEVLYLGQLFLGALLPSGSEILKSPPCAAAALTWQHIHSVPHEYYVCLYFFSALFPTCHVAEAPGPWTWLSLLGDWPQCLSVCSGAARLTQGIYFSSTERRSCPVPVIQSQQLSL